MNALYNQFAAHLRKTADVNYASALLQWDQETYMPPQGAAIRGQQLATLAGIAHEMSVDPKLGEWLEKLAQDTTLTTVQQRNVALAFQDYRKRNNYTAAFVEALTKAISEAFNAWTEARHKNDFSLFAPSLEKIVAFKREEAQLLGYAEHPYDALIDQFEPGTTVALLEPVFEQVKNELGEFIRLIAERPEPRDAFMYELYPFHSQWDIGLSLLRQMGYDFEAGRQDKSDHPFTINFNSRDVRVTTRVNEHNLHEMIWSCIHEGGHALYEQGLPFEEYGLPLGEAASLGIHESQSRLWENVVGRGLPYWQANYETLRRAFPASLESVSLQEFYRAMNKVKPSLIRTNADELTYHFHVLIRFELEKALIEGSLAVKDLPEAWNALYRKYLNIEVPSAAEGVLQDVHWSHGSFGYFPTYSLGSFYAAQFYETALLQVKGMEAAIIRGDMQPLLRWLRTHIHRYGREYTAGELCKKITGRELDFSAFMAYARKKYTDLYSL